MTGTCRAAVFLGDGTFEVRDFPIPPPPPGGAVLAVEAVGLCGSDVAQFHGVELVPGGSAFPVVPGHETVGRVVKLAADADLGVSEGQRVVVDEILSVDPFRLYGYSDMTGDGQVGLWGGYGEYMEIFAGTRLLAVSDDRPAEEFTLFEPLANAVNWVSVAGVHEGDVVVIEGPGHQGLAVLEAVLARRPAEVVVTGTSDDGVRLDAARAIGARHVVAVDRDDVKAVVADLTAGRGADVVLRRGQRAPDGADGHRPGAGQRPHPARRPQALRGHPRSGQRPDRPEGLADLRRLGLHARVHGHRRGHDRGGPGPLRSRGGRGLRTGRHRRGHGLAGPEPSPAGTRCGSGSATPPSPFACLAMEARWSSAQAWRAPKSSCPVVMAAVKPASTFRLTPLT